MDEIRENERRGRSAKGELPLAAIWDAGPNFRLFESQRFEKFGKNFITLEKYVAQIPHPQLNDDKNLYGMLPFYWKFDLSRTLVENYVMHWYCARANENSKNFLDRIVERCPAKNWRVYRGLEVYATVRKSNYPRSQFHPPLLQKKLFSRPAKKQIYRFNFATSFCVEQKIKNSRIER